MPSEDRWRANDRDGGAYRESDVHRAGDEQRVSDEGGASDERDAGDERCVVGEQRVFGVDVDGTDVFGVDVDAETRCAHYDSDVDVVAIRFACCGEFYPCHACHDAVADHDPEQWPRDSFDAVGVCCGACGSTLSIASYLDCEDECPECEHAFNPGCARHAEYYFDV